MKDILQKKITRVLDLTHDLIEHLSQESLSLKLGDLPSNKIGEQVWCIIGARESYFKAIQLGQWSGFSCSLQNNNSKLEALQALKTSSESISNYLIENDLSKEQTALLFDLLEHELVHHGQLIRYVYGNKLSFPKSWEERYTV